MMKSNSRSGKNSSSYSSMVKMLLQYVWGISASARKERPVQEMGLGLGQGLGLSIVIHQQQQDYCSSGRQVNRNRAAALVLRVQQAGRIRSSSSSVGLQKLGHCNSDAKNDDDDGDCCYRACEQVLAATDFMRACHMCRRPLSPHQDIHMYRGDQAFCSVQCRWRQIVMDESKNKCKARSRRRPTTSRVSGQSLASCSLTVSAR